MRSDAYGRDDGSVLDISSSDDNGIDDEQKSRVVTQKARVITIGTFKGSDRGSQRTPREVREGLRKFQTLRRA